MKVLVIGASETNVGLLISALSATCFALNFLCSLASLIFSPRTKIGFCALGKNMVFLFFIMLTIFLKNEY